MTKHLAILNKKYLDLILEGKKTIEARFSKIKSPPYGKVEKDDEILFKEKVGKVRGEAKVKDVEYYSKLTPDKIYEIVDSYREGLRIDEEFLNSKIESNYLTLIFLSEIEEIRPYSINKRDPRAWVVMERNLGPLFEFK